MKKVRDVIGGAFCFGCGRPVEIRVNSGARGPCYYMCDATMVDDNCNDHHRWGGATSTRMKNTAQLNGWIGPMPASYMPPTDNNHFRGNYETRLKELREQFGVPDDARGKWTVQPSTDTDEPRARSVEPQQPRPDPEPAPGQQLDPGAGPVNKRRGLFGRGAA